VGIHGLWIQKAAGSLSACPRLISVIGLWAHQADLAKKAKKAEKAACEHKTK